MIRPFRTNLRGAVSNRYLISILQYGDKIAGLRCVGRGKERVRCALVRRTTRSADPMYVIFRVVGKVKVYNKLDVVHI